MSKVWLVTGSASGLGRNIAEAVLASGDHLVATARDPGRLEDLVEKYGDQVPGRGYARRRCGTLARGQCIGRRGCSQVHVCIAILIEARVRRGIRQQGWASDRRSVPARRRNSISLTWRCGLPSVIPGIKLDHVCFS
jgi:NAD(P)-dependent dehydrogenase (short-subunit alcohol dehydrogenase family)